MLERINSILLTHCQLAPGAKVLAAVSGGPDSLCMLDVLWQSGYALVVAHFDHQMRPESREEALAMRKMVDDLNLPFCLGQQDVRAYAERHHLSEEEAARQARYGFLFEQARLVGAQAVVVGHTADDQVETLLMHLLRGAGLAGLRGMSYRSLPNAWSQDIPLVRPLLGTWRSEIQEYMRLRGLQPLQDASNLDMRYFRNRLRHELIPYLEGYNPQLRQVLWRTAYTLGEDYTTLERLVDAAWEECLHTEGAGYLAFNLPLFKEKPLSLKRALLRKAIGCLRPGLRDIDFGTIERGVSFLEAPSRRNQIDLATGLRLFMEGNQFWLTRWEADLVGSNWPQMVKGSRLQLEVPGSIALGRGWQIQAEILHAKQEIIEQARTNADLYQGWFDLDTLQLPLEIRTRRPGERFQPLGMEGHSVKLSDFFVNVKLPGRARQDWPLVVSGEQVAWVPGFRLGELFRVQSETKHLVRLSLVVSSPPASTPTR